MASKANTETAAAAVASDVKKSGLPMAAKSGGDAMIVEGGSSSTNSTSKEMEFGGGESTLRGLPGTPLDVLAQRRTSSGTPVSIKSRVSCQQQHFSA